MRLLLTGDRGKRLQWWPLPAIGAIIICGVALGFIGARAFGPRPLTEISRSANSPLRASPGEVLLGRIRPTDVGESVTLQNRSRRAVRVERIVPSCWCVSGTCRHRRIAPGGKAEMSFKLTGVTTSALYLNQFAKLRVRVAHHPSGHRDMRPWNLLVRLRAMPDVPFVVLPGSFIFTKHDFVQGVATSRFRIVEAAGSKAVLVGVFSRDRHFTVKHLKRDLFCLTVKEPAHADIGTLRIVYKWGARKSYMGVGVFVYKP
jgi:hypothetical protein